jgi:hypothetical protein
MIPEVVKSPVPSDGKQEEALAAGAPASQQRTMLWLGTTVVFICVGFALLLAVGIRRFGSTASALAYLRGESLIPDAYSKSFGTVAKDERPTVEFLLRNWGKQPIKVRGVTRSCTCLATSDLPIVIPPHGEAILQVSSRATSRLGQYSQRLRVFTDAGQSNLVLGIQGVFR